jgi:DNA polymerase I-like protein with 3'-5' exonuclease and polymerase domains
MIIRDVASINALISKLKSELYLAFDLETSGVNDRHDSITDIAIAGATWEANVVMQEFNGSELINVLTIKQCAPLINALKIKRLIMHNAPFDFKFITRKFGVHLYKALYADTMTLQHLLNENLFNYGLKELGTLYFGPGATSEKADMLASIKANGGTEKQFYKANSDLRALYAMKDVRLTYDLWKRLDAQLDGQGLRKFYYDLETVPLAKHVLIPAELKGIPVDVDFLQQSQTEISLDVKTLEAKIQQAIEPLLDGFKDWLLNYKYAFQLNGPFLQALAAKIAPPNWPRTDSGSYSFNKAEITKAIKKNLISAGSDLELYATGKKRVPSEIQKTLQWELATRESDTYLFNIESTDHLKRLFFGTSTTESALKETPLSITEHGAPQVDDDFLEAMAKKYDWAKDLQTYRSLRKIESTYIERFLTEQEGGIFYPRFMQHRAVTGRLSGDTQQLPRPLEPGEAPDVVIKYNNRIRRFFISGPDHTFADLDYDSQEVKVFAHVSGEQKIKDIFARGDDFYSAVCIDTEGLTGYSADKKAPNYLGKAAKGKRQAAKAYALGLAFNMSPYKLKYELNCSEEQAKELYNKYFAAYPALKNWLENSKAFALKNGYIKNEAGRYRRFDGLVSNYAKFGPALLDGLELWKKYNDNPGMYAYVKKVAGVCKNHLNAAANFQIQSLAASITSRAAIKAAKEYEAKGMQSYICNLVHDEIVVRSPNSELKQSLEILQRCMETAYEISVPLTAPQSSGKNFAESK